MNLLITGGTGFLGKNILARLVNDPQYNKIFLLIRPSANKTVRIRLDELIAEVFPPELHHMADKKFIPLESDLTKKYLGLSVEDYQNLALDLQQILHVGASTDFGAPLDISRKYNVDGTRNVIELAKVAARTDTFKGLEYISTAFVAGIKKGLVSEQDLTRGQQFANNYEQSKWEAECLVRQYQDQLPVTIYRPSIVVGDSRTGYTSHFKVLYWPLRLLSKNLLPFVPLGLQARLDVVPVDYVTESIVRYMKLEYKPEKILHITSGVGNEVRIKELLKDAHNIAQIRRRPVLPMFLFDVLRQSFLRRILSKEFWQTCDVANPYYYYLKGTGVRFDARASDRALEELGIKKPVWQEYKKEILSFCKRSHWGRRIHQPIHTFYEHKP